jgi:hypothetical protein
VAILSGLSGVLPNTLANIKAVSTVTDRLLLHISLIIRRLTPIALANCPWVTASGYINSSMSISPTLTG